LGNGRRITENEIQERKCDCGTPDQALFWCYIHGYLIKPPVVHRKGTVVRESAEPVRVHEVTKPTICTLKSKCLRAVKRQGALIVGKGFGHGLYCSRLCVGRAKAFAKSFAVANSQEHVIPTNSASGVGVPIGDFVAM
jgi:hypothetical protein